MKKKYCIFAISILSLCCFLKPCFAQDVVYSQSYASHLNLNPALTGLSHTPTIALNFRDQWNGFQGGYKTYSVSIDKHFAQFNSGLGLQIANDRALQGAVNHLQVSALYSYFVPITGNWGSTIGLQATLNQRSFDYNQLIFGDQVSELTGFQPISVSTNEVLDLGNSFKSYFSLSGGFLLFSNTFYLGATFKNINRPNISVAKIEEESALPMYISFHAGNTFNLNDVSGLSPYVAPNIFYANQGKYHQIMAGAQAGAGFLFTGLWARYNINNFDALILLLGFEKGIVKAGYSYDMSVGQPGKFTGNTHEISVVITPLENATESKQRNIKRGLMCPRIL